MMKMYQHVCSVHEWWVSMNHFLSIVHQRLSLQKWAQQPPPKSTERRQPSTTDKQNTFINKRTKATRLLWTPSCYLESPRNRTLFSAPAAFQQPNSGSPSTQPSNLHLLNPQPSSTILNHHPQPPSPSPQGQDSLVDYKEISDATASNHGKLARWHHGHGFVDLRRLAAPGKNGQGPMLEFRAYLTQAGSGDWFFWSFFLRSWRWDEVRLRGFEWFIIIYNYIYIWPGNCLIWHFCDGLTKVKQARIGIQLIQVIFKISGISVDRQDLGDGSYSVFWVPRSKFMYASHWHAKQTKNRRNGSKEFKNGLDPQRNTDMMKRCLGLS